MIKRLAIHLACLALFHSPLAGQALRSGVWTGSATPPGQEPLALTYDVSTAGDSISILMRTSDRGDYPVTEAKLVGDTLTFRFRPGALVQCTLLKQGDGSFSGECVGEDDLRATLVMIPPANPTGSGG
jgi:hypothetical protein